MKLDSMNGYRMYTVIALVLAITLPASALDCRRSSVAKYNLLFNPRWSKSQFPKQYPLFRPPASWSSVVGKYIDYC